MLASIGQYNPKPDVKNYNKPAFTALYFKNKKVQKMVKFDPNFAHEIIL